MRISDWSSDVCSSDLFDGTLADTLPWFESILDGVADKYGFRKAGPAERAQLRHRGAHEILKILGIPMWKMPAILSPVRQLMCEIDPRVQMFAAMAEALTQEIGSAACRERGG